MQHTSDEERPAEQQRDGSGELCEPGDAEGLFHKEAPGADEECLDGGDLRMLEDVKAGVLGGEPGAVRIGHFEVLRVLGEGGMGKVYEAVDPKLGRKVAIKVHKEEAATPEQHERMRREGRMLAQLEHDNVVQVHELVEHGDRVCVVMERVEGKTLKELQQPGPLPWPRAVALYAMAGRGLGAAHDEDIVHRDFKPANVIVDRTGRCKVLDFGVARELSAGGVEQTTDAKLEERGAVERVPGSALTRSKGVLGTPAYMAPEVHVGQPATPHSDQFSFCVALYEAVYGCLPYRGKSPESLSLAKQEGPPAAPEGGPEVPGWLLALLRRGLAVDPRDRYPSMGELLADLERSRVGRGRAAAWSLGSFVAAAAMVAAFMDFSSVASDPHLQRERGRVSACWDAAEGVRDRWVSVRDVRGGDDEELDDVSPVIDGALGGFARELGASCLAAEPRFVDCREQGERDFEALLARVQEGVRLPEASSSGLAHDFALCLEGEASRTCTSPEDDGGSAAALSEAKSQLAVGRPGPAEDAALRALALAQAKGDRLGEVRATLVLAEIYDQTERVDEARKSLDDAIAQAIDCDALVPTVDTVLERVEVELHHRALGRADLAALPLAIARALLAGEEQERLSLRRALLDEKEAGVLLTIERRCEDALPLYQSVLTRRREALAGREQRGRPLEPLLGLVADAELNLGYGLLGCGKEAPAAVIGLFEAAREHRVAAAGGGDHPDLAAFDYGLGRALASYGRHEEAMARYEAALATYTKFGVAGDAGANAGDVHAALADVLRSMGRFDEAQRHALANLELRRSNAKARSPGVLAEALTAAGMVAIDLEAYEDGRRHHQEAVDVLLDEAKARGLVARDRRTLAHGYGNLALALCGLRRTSECEIAYEEGRRWQLEPSQLANVGNALREHGCLR